MIKNKTLNLSQYRNLYVIGDIHGEYNRLMTFLQDIEFNKNRDILVSVGDLIDRGPRSLECLRLVNEPWFCGVLGNHEYMMYDAVVLGRQERLWHVNGGDWFDSLSPEERNESYQLIQQCFDETLPISLTVYFHMVKIGIIHAEPPVAFDSKHQGLRAMWDPTIIEPERALWAREEIRLAKRFDRSAQDAKYPVKDIDHVFCGHTPLKYPLHLHNTHWIDTGAVYRSARGYFTAAVISSTNPEKIEYMSESVS